MRLTKLNEEQAGFFKAEISSTEMLRNALRKSLGAELKDKEILDPLLKDKSSVFLSLGMTPDSWQKDLIEAPEKQILVCCSRQCFDADTIILDRFGRAMRICDHPDAWMTGVRPVKRYTVRGGASVTVTENHPLHCCGEWVAAGSLQVGDRISVMSEWDKWEGISTLEGYVEHGPARHKNPYTSFVSFNVTENLGKLIGYMMTDGSNRPGQSIKFTNTRKEYLIEVERIVEEITGVSSKHYTKGRGEDLLFTTTKARHDNRFTDLMRLIRWDERFPTDLFRCSKNVVIAAINRAWAGDGCISKCSDGRPDIHIACKNEIYGRYLQLLLMKMGIHSRMTTEWFAKSVAPFHRLILGGGRLNLQRFFNTVGIIYGKEKACIEAIKQLESNSKEQDYQKESHQGQDGEIFHQSKIIKIEELGDKQVWDISVPGKGWLVAQGIQAHNSGKSQTAAACALTEALLNPPAEVLIISRAQRQSAEVLRKVKELYRGLRGEKISRKVWKPKTVGGEIDKIRQRGLLTEEQTVSNQALSMEFANGSRIISLPGSPDTIVGYSAISLLVLDEAARIKDDLYRLVRPMLAVSGGRLICLSTPFGKRGWFWEEWKRCEEARTFGKPEPFRRFRVKAEDCPRITAEFLEEEKFSIGPRWYAQEYGVEFVDTVDSVFAYEDIHRALDPDLKPLFEDL